MGHAAGWPLGAGTGAANRILERMNEIVHLIVARRLLDEVEGHVRLYPSGALRHGPSGLLRMRLESFQALEYFTSC
jgi:hypothetical protein